MTNIHGPVEEGLLKELAQEEESLREANNELNRARAQFQVASRKYAAVRNMVTEYLGRNPYSLDAKRVLNPRPGFGTRLQGTFRFIHMRPGDAIIEVLKEAKDPLTLDEIVEVLSGGGIGITPNLLTRTVNAALMRTTGVQKTEEGKYFYKPDDVDDLPF